MYKIMWTVQRMWRWVLMGILLLAATVQVQPPDARAGLASATPTWARAYGGNRADRATAVQPTADGFVVAGITQSFGAGGDEVWIMKLNGEGNIQWQKTYGGTDYDWVDDLQPTADGGFIVVGSTFSFGAGSYDIWVLKLNAQGDIQWQKTYGGANAEYGDAIQPTADGGFIVAGTTGSFGAGGGDVWVLKLNAQGNVQWQKTYGGAGYDSATAIQPTADGGVVVAGITDSFGAGKWDIWVLKLNAQGNVQWQKTYGGAEHDWPEAVQPTADGGFIVAGTTGSFGAGRADVWVLKLDAQGDIQWQKTYGGTDSDWGFDLQPTADGEFVVAGYTASFGAGGTDAWVLKLDAQGNVRWQKTYGGADSDWATAIQPAVAGSFLTGRTRPLGTDAGFIVVGRTKSFGAGDWDVWVLKLDELGNVAGCTPAIVGNSSAAPANSSASVSASNVAPADSAATVGTTSVTPAASSANIATQCPPVELTHRLYLPLVVR